MGLEYDPRAHAESLGIAIKVSELPTGWRGAYSHYRCTIYIVKGMSMREERSTLAHEVAHGIAGDEFTDFLFFTGKQENRANFLASRALIDFEEYRRAEKLVGAHTPSLAYELNVTESVLKFWQRWLSGSRLPNFEEEKYQ